MTVEMPNTVLVETKWITVYSWNSGRNNIRVIAGSWTWNTDRKYTWDTDGSIGGYKFAYT
jgi:hypothetical protein